MSQPLPLPGGSYPSQTSRASSSHQAFGHAIYGYQSHPQQTHQQPRPHLPQRHPSQHHEMHSSHMSNPPPAHSQSQSHSHSHSHSLAQHVPPRLASHGPLQHLLPSSQMPPPPCHVSRPDDAHHHNPGSVAPGMSFKPAGSQQSMVSVFSKIDEVTGRKYQLDVVQQPKRARMCGFGDKDRRPITPPPCVRLIITDVVTGKEIDCK
ncbi:hypothetical protein E4U42_005609 [Claviceps africana]|uniref:Velvet domain-containing protein n=1 Tax=Claviceps africana TaxID=83212 RepID=A0A8K0NHB4_9HYPO|nr:hypothetical protein E4U42_005609 [Claviceps africana]